MHAVELGPHQAGNLALGNRNDHITFTDSDENQTFDFPVSLQVQRIFTIFNVSEGWGCLPRRGLPGGVLGVCAAAVSGGSTLPSGPRGKHHASCEQNDISFAGGNYSKPKDSNP